MKFIEVNIYQLTKKKNKQMSVSKIIDDFIETGFNCAMVVDDCGHYHDNNNLYRALHRVLKEDKYNVRLFMLNNEVYLERKDLSAENEQGSDNKTL